MKRILLLLLFVVFVMTGMIAGTGSAQDEPPGIPRDAFVDRQYSFNAQDVDEILVSAQAVSQPPTTSRLWVVSAGATS